MASTISAGTTTTTALSYSADTSGVLQLQTNGGTTAVTIDTSQNVGVGVTPSAWGSTSRALQFQSGVSIFSNTSGLGGVGNNVYSNPGTGDFYIATGFATRYYQYQGTHVWNTAASGTAGNAITFTQAMTLDTSGNLGLNVTPTVKLDVSSSSTTVTRFQGTNANGGFVWYQMGGATPTSSGYVGSAKQIVSGGAVTDFGITATANLVFGSNDNAERMRIDTSGNLFIGGSSGAPGVMLLQPAGNASGSPFSVAYSSSNSSSYTYHSMYYTGGSQYQFYVDWGGTVHARSITITSLSDQRLKTNIKDISTGLSQILALQPRNFDWLDGSKTNASGFIAQEFQQIFPNSVTNFKAGEDGVEYLAMNHEELIPTLVKAIQELSAQVTSLQATVETQATTIATLQNKIGA